MNDMIPLNRTFTLLSVWVLFGTALFAQSETKKVLFLGNSYTYFNNMPDMVADVALSMGDTLLWDAVTPGGYSLYDHSVSSASINKIKAGDWDYVVLQDQSQVPTVPDYQIPVVYGFASDLDSIVNVYNKCAETVFYMTWGRKNGDSLFFQVYQPWYKEPTYAFMDSLLRSRYMEMAFQNEAEVAPVGAVWRHIRTHHPGIELYNPDESHPSLAGSYVAACCFYTTFFRKDPSLISFDASLPSASASLIRNAVKTVVYDSLSNWFIGKYDSINAIACQTADLNELASSPAWQVYPNPSTAEVTIQLDDAHRSGQILIYNTSGRLVEREIIQGSATLDIEHLPPGIYILSLKGLVNGTVRLIKN